MKKLLLATFQVKAVLTLDSEGKGQADALRARKLSTKIALSDNVILGCSCKQALSSFRCASNRVP